MESGLPRPRRPLGARALLALLCVVVMLGNTRASTAAAARATVTLGAVSAFGRSATAPGLPLAIGQQDQQDTFFVTIRDRMARAVTMALPPLSARPGAEEYARQIHEVLWDDLHYSMVFDMVDPELYPPMSDGDGPPDFVPWRRTGAEALIHGIVGLSGGVLLVEFRMYDIASGDQIDGRRFTEPIEDVRQIAHEFSDLAVLHFTGIPGVASTRVAFVSDRAGPKEIFIMDYDGWGQARITRDGFLALLPAFSPSGDSILYHTVRSHRGIPRVDIGILRQGGGAPPTIIASEGQDTSPAWSPDGSMIAFASSRTGNLEIYTARPDGSGDRQVTFNSADDMAPTFSPNGRQIAFISSRAGGQHLYTVGVDGTNVTRLFVEGSQIDNPSWNPQFAELIAYTASIGGNNFEVFVYDFRTQQSRPLTRGFGRDEAPSWSPDGRQIVFESSQGGSTQIHAMGIDGSRLRQLTREGDNQSPSWGGRS